jgi:hypothetical protein
MCAETCKLLTHIKTLNFTLVDYEFKSELHSQAEHCHQNCEEYMKSKRDGSVKLVHGWLKVKRTFNEIDYLLHYCILEDNNLKDITPWSSISEKVGFAIDDSIQINEEITDKFLFFNAFQNPSPSIIVDKEE